MELLPIALAVIGLILGFFVGSQGGKSNAAKALQTQMDSAKVQADQLLEKARVEGETHKKEKILEAKEQALKFQVEAEKVATQQQRSIEDADRKLKQRENSFNQRNNQLKGKEKEISKLKESLTKNTKLADKKKIELEKKKEELDARRDNLDVERKEIDLERKELKLKEKELEDSQAELKQHRKELENSKLKFEEEEEKAKMERAEKLESIAGLTAEQAKNELKEAMTKKAETEAMAYIKDTIDEAKVKASKEAKKIVIQTIQRTAAEQAIENAVTVFNLSTDDIKGQIIGREGRNIRALEAATGVEIIVDDTPEAVIISGYDPLRRETARLSLKRLVADGRIHPARIEEVVEKTRKQLEQEVQEIGERTVIELNIHGLHAKLVWLVGKMRFRSSYGQNLLQHSKETARICATMAAELGLSKKAIKMAKRAGLLHDIGKVSEDNPELSHAILGMELATKYNEVPAICNAIGAHHDEIEMTHMISPIVQACDAISGSRPGARREILETYLQRIKDLENLAISYPGVEKAYAIQAGRELRIMVESDSVSDKRAEELSFEISQKIQSEMQYPGQIKVTVIREKRAINYAK